MVSSSVASSSASGFSPMFEVPIEGLVGLEMLGESLLGFIFEVEASESLRRGKVSVRFPILGLLIGFVGGGRLSVPVEVVRSIRLGLLTRSLHVLVGVEVAGLARAIDVLTP